MASHKYLGDYRLENVEKNGKLKTVAVYRGRYYRFINPEALRKDRTRLIVSAAVFWLAQLVALTVPSDWAHLMFVIMPMVFAMLPFWFASMGIYTAFAVRPPLRRDQAEKVESRFSGGSLIAALLSGASFTGSFVAFFTHTQAHPAGDVIFALCAAAQTAGAIVCFTARSHFRAEAVSEDSSDASSGETADEP